MNCIHWARSLPSGAKNMTKENSTRIGKNVTSGDRHRSTDRCANRRIRKDDSEKDQSSDSKNNSCQDLTNHARRLHAGQFLFQPLERISEMVMIEAKHVQHGGVQVTDVHGVFYDFIP